MEISKLIENKPKYKIYGLIGNINITTNNDNYRIITEYKFNSNVNNYLNSNKALASLKMVQLNENVLNKTINELSDMDIKKVSLAKALIDNKEYLVLNYFEKGLNYQEKQLFIRLFKKLSEEYHKTILIFTNDITFIWDIAEELFIVDNNQVINNYSKKDFLYINYENKPEIITFINIIKSKNLKIDYYKDVLDLLKAIYRMKG